VAAAATAPPAAVRRARADRLEAEQAQEEDAPESVVDRPDTALRPPAMAGGLTAEAEDLQGLPDGLPAMALARTAEVEGQPVGAVAPMAEVEGQPVGAVARMAEEADLRAQAELPVLRRSPATGVAEYPGTTHSDAS
jgi:hypothetical protein